MDRPCINPLDPVCPKSAPNYFKNVCKSFEHFKKLFVNQNNSVETILGSIVQTGEISESDSSDTSFLDILGTLCEFQYE